MLCVVIKLTMAIVQADSTPLGQTETVTPRFGSFEIMQALTQVAGNIVTRGAEVLETGKLISMAVVTNIVHSARTAHQSIGEWYDRSIQVTRPEDQLYVEKIQRRGFHIQQAIPYLILAGLVATAIIIRAEWHNMTYWPK